ncbi:MAG: radical SAM protein [Pirellulales bacterium]|nr:radical SAM protein [Pirellulales bacterium]
MMLTLINTNRMLPPIAPVGVDYIASAASAAGIDVELVDLCLSEDPDLDLERYFSIQRPEVVGLTFRNVDDCFWPSGQTFLPDLNRIVARLRGLTDSPVVLGGVGYSIFPKQIVERSGADFGIHGDGEQSIVDLIRELRGARKFNRVPGLVYRDGGIVRSNPPAWPSTLATLPARDWVNNIAYFHQGGQIGVETKRGCPRQCSYCADPLAKGNRARLRPPIQVAQEIELLLNGGIDVFHLCDPEFNLPPEHAIGVCDILHARGLGERIRWYAYLAVTPFSEDLAYRMRRAGCVGINFTSDAAHPQMLAAYRQPHRKEDLDRVVRLCRKQGITVMLDMLLGGPGETPETIQYTVEAFRQIDPDCAGAALGVRIYPNTGMAAMVAAEGPPESNPSIRRHYDGPVDWLQPTFYISSKLGDQPARLVRDLTDQDPRFFPPQEETNASSENPSDHNYNANRQLVDAIAAGARGAYWDILRKLRMAGERSGPDRS